MNDVHFVIPGLMQIPESWHSDLPAISALDRFFSRCHRSRQQVAGYEAVLCDLFGIQADGDGNLPLGAIRRFGITGVEERGNYLCADPVFLQAGQREIILQDSEHLGINQHEANELARLFNEYYANEGWRLTADKPMCWHLAGAFKHPVSLPPLGDVVNRKINQYLSASGSQSPYWRQIMNEIQMLFHDAEVNRLREAGGRPVINGLWLYGAGSLPETVAGRWQWIRSNHPLAAGLAKLAKSDYDRLPESFNDLITDKTSMGDTSKLCLIASDALHYAVGHDDFDGWKSAIEWLNNQWLLPAMLQLKRHKLKKIVVHDCAGHRYDITPSDLWRFWKPVKDIRIWARSK